ncbi:MAG TPA: hypothetical protein VNS63_08255 [Blastocatellia bacterium]|nr:hypothetical protein [Blastocatellia bacterium]
MLSIIVASTAALFFSWLVVRRSSSFPLQVEHRSSEVLTVAVQIVCGDCAGEGERPVRTCLDQSGRCARCGGTSYVLASELASNVLQLRAARLRVGNVSLGDPRLSALEARQAHRSSRAAKAAVS